MSGDRGTGCDPHIAANRPYRKGDKVIVVLRGAGVETREDAEVWKVSKGVVHTTDSDYGYEAATGRWTGPDFGGFSRRIEHAA